MSQLAPLIELIAFVLLYLTWPFLLLWLIVWVAGKAWKAARE